MVLIDLPAAKGNSVSASIFFEKTYGNRQFAAALSTGGPCIVDGATGSNYAGKRAVLGASTIVYYEPHRPRLEWGIVEVQGWWIAKYKIGPKICLDGLTSASRKQLALDFGLPVSSGDDIDLRRPREIFKNSSAFKGLCQWAVAHPAEYKRFIAYGNPALPWKSMVDECIQREGIAIEKAAPKPKGRPRILNPVQIQELHGRVASGERKTTLAREFGVSTDTIYRYMPAQ
jgi:hypothetical protein